MDVIELRAAGPIEQRRMVEEAFRDSSDPVRTGWVLERVISDEIERDKSAGRLRMLLPYIRQLRGRAEDLRRLYVSQPSMAAVLRGIVFGRVDLGAFGGAR